MLIAEGLEPRDLVTYGPCSHEKAFASGDGHQQTQDAV